MKPETWVAIYAAIVGTGALLLNFKSWFDSGVKLHLSVMADGMTIGGGEQFDENDITILTVTNRGDAPTIIRNMVLFEMPSLLQRLHLKRPTRTFIIPNPQLKGYPHNIPSELPRAQSWTGVIRRRPDLIPDILSGAYYCGVQASHRNRPYLIRVPKTKPEDDKLKPLA